LVFPNTYEVGMSNLGMHTLYSLLNSKEEIVAERFFVSKGLVSPSKLRSLESNRPASDFDIILFTISFETDYVNCVKFLHTANIPIRSHERPDETPLILAGGVATFINPEPLAPFVDAFLIGEFEAIVQPFVEQLPFLADQSACRGDKLRCLASKVTGTYVPAGYKVHYSEDQSYESHEPIESIFPAKIKPAKLTIPPDTAPHTTILTKDAVFPNTFLIELTRGCGMGCRFCAAGFVYRPPRVWPFEAVDKAVSKSAKASKIGLIGLEYGSRPDIERLAELLLKKGKKLGFSSLRADFVSPSFAELMAKSGAKVATIAPEAGSQRMRNIINKNLNEEEILEGVEKIATAGIPNFKLYFMIGLPFETEDDVSQIAYLVRKIHSVVLEHAKGKGSMGTISVSVNQFIPKPWTPFQWSDFTNRKDIKNRTHLLKGLLSSIPNLKFSLPSYREAMLQALLSRGDRLMSKIVESMGLYGFSLNRALKESSLSAEKYLKGRQLEAQSPWEIIAHPVKKEFLMHEWRKASRQKCTPPCNIGRCRRCDACSLFMNS